MKKPLLFLLVAFFSLTLSAQKVYYIYLQTEDQAPFYAKFLNKMYNSTESGYLIIPNLADSSYKVNIGFPTGIKPEMRFVISTNGSDRGFIIKDTTEPITLVDQNTEAVVKAENEEDKRIIGYETKTDRFSTILSKAADDPTLLKVPIRAKEEPKQEEQKTEVVLTKAEEPRQKEETVAVNTKKTKGKKKVVLARDKKELAVTEEPKKEATAEEPKKDVAIAGEPKNEEAIKVVKEPKDESTVLATEEAPKKKKSKKTHAEDVPSAPSVTVQLPATDTKETAAVQQVKQEETKPAEEPKKVEDKAPEQPKQEVVVEQPKPEPQPISPSETFKRSVVTRAAETSTTEGFGLVYYDIAAGTADTIRLLIPNPAVPLVADNAPKQDDAAPMLDPKKIAGGEETQPVTPKKERKKKKEKDVVVETEPAPAEKKEAPVVEVKSENSADQPVAKADEVIKADAVTNKACGAEASEKDFFKLRKSMAGKSTDEAMIEEAKKYFKTKCFTTEQIRYLSTLFLTSAGKYQFFDAAYDHTSNKEKFGSLQEEIKDAYYLKRFKALVGE